MSCFVNGFGYACITLKVMALISTLVGLGIPYWYQGDAAESTGLTGTVKTTVREGLWKHCTVLETTSTSSSFCVANDGMYKHLFLFFRFLFIQNVSI